MSALSNQELRGNPFALITNPQAVLQAVERSERLARLQSRICRPLDKPLIPTAPGDETAAFDSSVDAAVNPEAPADEAVDAPPLLAAADDRDMPLGGVPI